MPKKDNIIPFPTKEQRERLWGKSVLEINDVEEAQQRFNKAYKKAYEKLFNKINNT